MQSNLENLSTPTGQLHEEIAELERKLEEKKRLAEISGVESPNEKEVFRGVVREHIAQKKEQIYSSLPSQQARVQKTQAVQDADELKKLAEEKQLEELISIAMIKGPLEAAHIAEHMKNPKLLDDLHDYLTDQLYNHLIEIRKLRKV